MAEISADFDFDKNQEIGERLEHPESVCLAGSTFMKTWQIYFSQDTVEKERKMK